MENLTPAMLAVLKRKQEVSNYGYILNSENQTPESSSYSACHAICTQA
jgi:hypothetical protein